MIDETLVAQFLDCCEDEQNLSTNTVNAYRQDLKSFLQYHQSINVAAGSDRETVLRYLRFLRNAKSLKPSTVQRRMATLRMCLNWNRRFKPYAPSPFDGLQLRFRNPKLIPRAIDMTTLQKLFDGCELMGSSRLPYSQADITHLILRVLLLTGLRIGELCGLNIENVFSQDAKIRVMGKGSRERIVFITNKGLRTEFAKFMSWRRATDKQSTHLFPNRCGERLTPPAFRMRLKLLCEDRGITPHLTPHQFRHSAATLLIENGVDIRMVQRLLGHASIATTELYTHVTDQALEATLARADILAYLEPTRRQIRETPKLTSEEIFSALLMKSSKSLPIMGIILDNSQFGKYI